MDNKDKSDLASQSQAAQPSIDIDHDEFWKHVMAYCRGTGNEGKALVDYVNSWLRAHLAGQSQAAKVQAVPEGLRKALDELRVVLQMATPSIDQIHEHGPDSEIEKAWQIFYDDVMPALAAPTAQEVTQQAGECNLKSFAGHGLCSTCEKVGRCLGPYSESTQQAAKAETAEQAEGVQDHVVPPFAAPAMIVGAPVAASDKPFYDFWYGHMLDDLMQPPLIGIPHSTARYIWDAACRCRAQRTNNDTDISDLAPTTSTATASGSVPTELRNAFMTLESNGGEGRTLVLKFNQREDAYAVHDFLLKGGGREWSASAQASQAAASEVRNAALEEAAKVCESDDQKYESGRYCAVAIRALLGTAVTAALRTNPATPASKPNSTNKE